MKVVTVTSRPSSTSVLDLPIEVRMQILSYLVNSYSTVVFANFVPGCQSQLSLFLTCRAISNDCCELLYGTNTYTQIHRNLHPLVTFVKKIGPENARRIKRFHMESHCFHFIKSRPSISRNATYLCQLLPSIERLQLAGIGPGRRDNVIWKPSHLKTVEAFITKAGGLFNGTTYVKLSTWGDSSVIIYRNNSDLLVPSNEFEIDTTDQWLARGYLMSKKEKGVQRALQAKLEDIQ